MNLAQIKVNGLEEPWIFWGVFAISLLVFIFPRIAWSFGDSWKYRHRRQPSRLWILSTRISALLVAGVMLFLYFDAKTPK